MPTAGGGGDGAGGKVYRKFTSRDSGVPFTLAGSPAISIYKDDSTTESTTGVTLTVDFDAKTGLNHVTVDTSADTTFYAAGHHYDLVITAGTVNGTSVVSECVGTFDLVTPSSSEVVRTNTAQAGSSTTITLDSGASSSDNLYQYDTINIVGGTGAGQARFIISYVGSTKVATVDSAWTTNPDSTSVFTLTQTAKSIVASYVSGQDPGTLTLNAFATASDAVIASPSPTTTAFAGSNALSSSDTFYVGSVVMFTSGVLDGLARKITTYTGATRLITAAWPTAPSSTDAFRILGRID